MKQELYSIIDVETTGGDPKSERITEIAIVIHDGEKIVDQYSSLVNPEVAIPEFITRITGIDNDMVRDAPRFYEIARKVVELTEGAIFVAHNARFDYSFVRKEFRRLGYTFTRKQLCTVKLSRKLMPGLKSYSLGNLCTHLGIQNTQAHRALSDTLATTQLFEHLLRLSEGSNVPHTVAQTLSEARLPKNLPTKVIDRLPDAVGVYYFLDARGEVLYVGKSTNIRKRVMSHFSGALRSRRTMEMVDLIHDLYFEITGSDLIALLHENEEIKRLQPPYNRAQRRKNFKVGVYQATNEAGYMQLYIDTYDEDLLPVAGFSGRAQAEGSLTRWGRHFGLCPKLYGAEQGPGRCFHHQLHICQGACIGEEEPETYNERVAQAVSALGYGRDKLNSFFIVGEGRSEEERSVVYVERGLYRGHGFLELDLLNQPPEEIASSLPRKPEAPDVQRIIQGYVKKHPREIVPIQDSVNIGR